MRKTKADLEKEVRYFKKKCFDIPKELSDLNEKHKNLIDGYNLLINSFQEKSAKVEFLQKNIVQQENLQQQIDSLKYQISQKDREIRSLKDEIAQNHRKATVDHLAQIKLTETLLKFNGLDDVTHRDKKHHTRRAITLLENEYKEVSQDYDKYNDRPF